MSDDTATHSITIVVTGRYPHGREHPQASVTVNGDCSLEHAVDSFRAALVAMGFACATAATLNVGDD
jgi:hypothetical protein